MHTPPQTDSGPLQSVSAAVKGGVLSFYGLNNFICSWRGESKELKSLLRKVNKESEKVGLKLNIHKTKIMTSGPTTLQQIDGETMETVTEFIFLGSKVTADCSHEIKHSCSLEEKLWST